jgi:hypothetical protein
MSDLDEILELIASFLAAVDAAEVEAISDGLPYSNTRHFGSDHSAEG